MLIRKVHVDALAPTGAMVFAGTVLTKFGPHIDTGPDAEGLISFAVVAESVQCFTYLWGNGLSKYF